MLSVTTAFKLLSVVVPRVTIPYRTRMMRLAMNELLSLSTPLLVVLIVAPLIMIPNVETVSESCAAPPASSRLRMTLFVAPLPAAVPLASQIAAVDPNTLVLATVRLRPVPVPPMRPSIVTLSALFSLIIAPTMLPETVTAAVGRTVNVVHNPAFNVAEAVSVVLAVIATLTLFPVWSPALMASNASFKVG